MARGKIVAAVEHEIRRGDELAQTLAFDTLLERNDPHLRIDCMEPIAGRLHLGTAHVRACVQDLALQVGEIDAIVIGERERSNAGGDEELRNRGTESSRADDERVRSRKSLLRIDAE